MEERRHPHTLQPVKTGLLVIDVQDKFAPVIAGFDDIVQNIVKLVLTFQMYRMPILVTEQYPHGLGNTAKLIRNQFELLEIIEKTHFACTDSPEFMARLLPLGLERVVACGIESHVCVNQTALGLLQRGISVHVVADATGSRNRSDHDIALQKMIQAGVIPATTEMVLFELTSRAGTQEFKNVQRMVKSRINITVPEPVAAAGAPVFEVTAGKSATAKPLQRPEPDNAGVAADVQPAAADVPAPEEAVELEDLLNTAGVLPGTTGEDSPNPATEETGEINIEDIGKNG